MVAAFLPSSVGELQDAEAIALLQTIQRCVVQVSRQQGTTAVATAYASYSPESSLAALQSAPMLLLPGFDSSLLEFRRLLPLLAKHQDVWAIDRYGSGFTEYVPTLAVNAQTIRQHLLSVLETWIRQPVILVGASLGGAVALDFALHYPRWVRSIVLIDSVGFSGSFPVGALLPQPLIAVVWTNYVEKGSQ
jgi:pimeloyl-ACP methyl ester carboxylesterase